MERCFNNTVINLVVVKIGAYDTGILLPNTPQAIFKPETTIYGNDQSAEYDDSARSLRREKRNRIYKLIAPLAATAIWMSGAVIAHADTINPAAELGVHKVETLINPSHLEIHNASATEAIANTYQSFRLGKGYYLDNLSVDSGFATIWSQYQLLNMLDVARRTGVGGSLNAGAAFNQALKAANSYWGQASDTFPAGYDATKNFGLVPAERYVDDNLWMGNLYFGQYQKTGNQVDANRVKSILSLFLSQRGSPSGGAYWEVQSINESNRDQCMVSNATAIPTLIGMYVWGQGDESYVKAAQQTFDWTQKLRDPATGLYFDKIMTNGQIDKTIYTYGQAEMLDAMVALNKIDRIMYPMSRAIDFAKLSADYFANRGGYGISKFDVIYLQSLMRLSTATEDLGLIEATRHAIKLAKAAIHNSPNDLADASAAATIMALAELPFDQWGKI